MSVEPTYVWMQREDLKDLPETRVPSGYRIRHYRTGDAALWLDIVRRTRLGEMFPDASFEKEFPVDEATRGRRVQFAEDESGSAVGTITAWYGKEGPGGGWGLVHWFSVLPGHQGRGVGRALLGRALHEIAAWHTSVLLTCEISLLAALKLYLDHGFEPGINGKEDRLAWKEVLARLGHPRLERFLNPPPEPAAPDTVVAQLKAAAVPLSGCVAGAGFEDLRPLAGIVGDARIVSMGEATHGTREFFQLKHRLLEYLVTEHGFTAFGIEASFPECVMLDRFVTTGEGDPLDGITNMRFWTWNTEEVRDLVLWMRRHNERAARQVRFYGFDMQSPALAVRDVIRSLRRWHPERAVEFSSRLAALADDFGADAYASLRGDRQMSVMEALREAGDLIRHAPWGDSRDRAMACLHAAVAAQGEELLRLGYEGGRRDRAMADNVRALLDLEGPEGRIALWAHNYHVGKAGTEPMGVHLHRSLGPKQVVVGFAFGHGSFQAWDHSGSTGLRDFTAPPSASGSLDETLFRTGFPVLALGLNRIPLESEAGRWIRDGRVTRSTGAVFSDDPEATTWFGSKINVAEHYDLLLFVAATTAARRNPDQRRLPPRRPPGDPGAPDPSVPEAMDQGLPREWRTSSARLRSEYGWIVADGIATLSRREAPWEWGYGLLDQAFDATPYRGNRVRVRAEGRAVGGDEWSASHLVLAAGKGEWGWLFSGDLLAFNATTEDPWRGDDWSSREVELAVPSGAESILIAFVLCGNGTASIRNIRIETVT